MAKFKNFEMPAEEFTKGGWISVEEKLPEKEELYIVYTKDYGVTATGYLFWGGEYHWMGYNTVTHWMPLPEPPERKEQP